MNIHGRIRPPFLAIQEITVHTDTRDILAHARRNAIRRGLQDMFVVDIDAHHVETVSWKEIVTYIEDPVTGDNIYMSPQVHSFLGYSDDEWGTFDQWLENHRVQAVDVGCIVDELVAGMAGTN